MAVDFLGGLAQQIANPPRQQGPDILNAARLGMMQSNRSQDIARQEAQAQQQEKTRKRASFARRLLDTPPQGRKEMMGLAVQSGGFDPEFNDVIGQLGSLPDDQIGLAAEAFLRESGFESFIPSQGKRSTATLSKGQDLVDTATGQVIASGQADTTDTDKNLAEIRKEVRGRVGGEVKDISRQAAVINQNYNKVQNLAKQVEKGNRISASQALTALVKLGDPGSVVSGQEVRTALNTQTPLAAMTELLTSKGVSGDVVSAVAQRFDPLNPKNINTENLMDTANALTSANVPNLQARFLEGQNLAGENLTESGVKSLFPKGLSDRISKLSELAGGGDSGEQTATNPQTGEKLVLRNGQWQPM